uniref:Ig-like domain-containing protein n=1 Tax=Mola mola TaxID=94237 RepID=A0A3Q3XGG8_MOLML
MWSYYRCILFLQTFLTPELEPLHLRYGQEQWEEGDLYDKEKQQKPQFKKKLTSIRMKRFGPAHFECRLTPIGDPTMVVEWLHDGKPLAAANRLRMVNEFGYCSLDYEAAYARDSGVITCRASNNFGVDQTSATLIVKDEKGLIEETHTDEEYEKTKPEIVLLPEPARVLEGDIARFRCRVTGYPAPKVNWYLNGQLIRKSKRYRLNYDGIYYLEIVDVKSYDSGEVRVVADNPLGTTEHTKVQLSPSMEAPKILERITSKTVAPMDEVRFRVRVVGRPEPECQWFKNGILVEKSDHIYWFWPEDHVCELVIRDVTAEDSASIMYTCRAANNAGEATSTATLTITEEEEGNFWIYRLQPGFV